MIVDIIKFIPESIIEEISPLIERIFIRIENKKTELDIQSLVKTRRGYHEDVSDLNGITIPIMFFERMLENIEKVSQYILIKLQLILENQKTINEIIVNQATMIEELYNALNGPVNVSSSDKSDEKEIKENPHYIEYPKPKKENMN